MRHRTLRRGLLFPVLGALALSACASDDDSGGGGGSASNDKCVTSTDIKTVTPGAGQAAPAPSQSSSGGSGTGKTYTIGSMGPLSGSNAQLGININNAVHLAVDQANASGSLPFKLAVVESDDEGVPDKGPAAAQRLIDNKSVVAVVGPAFSGVTNAAEPLFTDAGLMSVSPSATNPSLTKGDFKTFARVVLPDTIQGAQAAEFISKHADKAFVIDDTSDYGVGLADAIETELKGKNVDVQREGLPDTTQDFNTIAQTVVQADVDAVYYAGYYSQAGPFAKALKAAGYECLVMSGDGSNDDQFVQLAGSDGDGWLFTCPCTDARSDPRASDFNTAYKGKFNVDPGTFSPEGYDATNAIIQALASIQGDVTRAKAVDAIKAVDYTGLTKKIKFKPNGDIDGQDIYVYGVEDGKRVLKGITPDLIK